MKERNSLPFWLRIKAPPAEALSGTARLLREVGVRTVCEEARCPNMPKCFSQGSATFILLGPVCTRGCRFCAVESGIPPPPDPGEPGRVARAAEALKLKHVVLTSVTRDDLPDGGASHLAAAVAAVREALPEALVETLIPDFNGSEAALEILLEAEPDIVSHNLETIPRLYPTVRPRADYRRSLLLLARVKEKSPDTTTKSGLMLGLGERHEEVLTVLKDLRSVGCDLLTLGQYLSPSPQHHPVMRYITPTEFESYAHQALEMGFKSVLASPLVRSSQLTTDGRCNTKC